MVRVSDIAEPLPEFQAMNEEEQEFLRVLAAELIAILEDAEKALATKIVEQRMDNDEYLALWGLLPAKVRTAIKRGSQ